MKTTLTKIALVATLLSPLLASATPTNLITDGSFEDFTVSAGHWQIFGSGHGWTTGKYGVEVRDNVAGVAEAGSNFVELDTTRNSWISQAVSTTSAEPLTLSFWYAPRAGVSANSNAIAVFWNGVKIETVKGNGNATTAWTEYTTTVFAKSGSNVLKFAARGPSDSFGGSLDNVSLTTAVPEPESYAMLIAGLGLIGTMVRRRRAAQAR